MISIVLFAALPLHQQHASLSASKPVQLIFLKVCQDITALVNVDSVTFAPLPTKMFLNALLIAQWAKKLVLQLVKLEKPNVWLASY